MVLKITKIFGFVFGLMMAIFIISTTGFVAMNIRLEWFPSFYAIFLEQLKTNSLLTLGWIGAIFFYLSITRDMRASGDEGIINADLLSSNSFYRIKGDITEKDGNIIASLDEFENISGSKRKQNVTATIKKEKFPFFVLDEKNEQKKIFPGSFMKVVWSQNITTKNI